MEDATQVALLDQERAGVDVLSTGEMGRVRFIIGFYDHLQGIRALPEPRLLGQPHWDTNTPFQVIEKVSAPAGLGIVDEFKLARSLTTRPLKATVPGPYTLMFPLRPGGPYRDRDTLRTSRSSSSRSPSSSAARRATAPPRRSSARRSSRRRTGSPTVRGSRR